MLQIKLVLHVHSFEIESHVYAFGMDEQSGTHSLILEFQEKFGKHMHVLVVPLSKIEYFFVEQKCMHLLLEKVQI